MEPVTVYRSFNAADANLIASRLEASGFNTFVAHEISSLTMDGYALAAGGIEVQVPAEQAKDARELIESASTDENAEESDASPT